MVRGLFAKALTKIDHEKGHNWFLMNSCLTARAFENVYHKGQQKQDGSGCVEMAETHSCFELRIAYAVVFYAVKIIFLLSCKKTDDNYPVF